ncbi:neuromedin-U isoform X1 [Crotalus tigris]|uniref:neuromedin-U isoform X1 n=1 Tax=Crotalus tigris TaxID=88082 RepID=UPI00192FA6F5|nr:neuromedin-U isoform X1 [Crotalus tigris]
MRRESACSTQPELRPLPAAAFAQDGSPGKAGRPSRGKPGPGIPWRLLLALLAFGVSSCKGAPVVSHVLQGEKVWNEIEDMCSAIPAIDTLPQPSNALEEFCFMVLEFLQNDKLSPQRGFCRRLVSRIIAQIPLVTHPMLPLVPQLHDRRQKRYKADEELQIPGGVQSRRYFMFRPRNGRRSATFY